jgi:hypothetical protein
MALSGAMAANAGAAYHLMKVSEVHQGTGGAGLGDFVELQAYAAGQNLVTGHYVRTYDGGGGEIDTFQFPGNAANGENQRSILIANDASVTGADFIAPGGLNVVQNGSVCYLDNLLETGGIDCVSLGNAMNAGLPSPAGTPVPLAGDMLGDNQSVSRKISPNCATLLEEADDTNNSAVDFALATPSPRNNATAPTETACPAPPSKAKKCKKKKKKKGKGKASAAAKKKCKKKKKKK